MAFVLAVASLAASAAEQPACGGGGSVDGAPRWPRGWRARHQWLEQQVTPAPTSIRMRDGTTIDARLYTPPAGVTTVAGLVFAHGGCFAFGDCQSSAATSRMFAALGVAVIDSSYRQGAVHPHPAALDDLADVARHARAELWPDLPVGVAGGSSGGFLALALASEPPDGTPFPFALGLCPVAHPQRRADYLASCARGTAAEDGYRRFLDRQTADGMLRAQTGYFGGSVEAMTAPSELLMNPGRHHHRPTRTLVILGGRDLNVPPRVTEGLASWATKTITLGTYGHELNMQPPPNEQDSYVPEVGDFITSAIELATTTDMDAVDTDAFAGGSAGTAIGAGGGGGQPDGEMEMQLDVTLKEHGGRTYLVDADSGLILSEDGSDEIGVWDFDSGTPTLNYNG